MVALALLVTDKMEFIVTKGTHWQLKSYVISQLGLKKHICFQLPSVPDICLCP